MITHLEPDILECEAKWALGSITAKKASGRDGIPVELFEILKEDEAVSAALNMPANLENSSVNSAVVTGLQKISFHSNSKEKQCQRMIKIPHDGTHLNASKVMFKILQTRLQQYMNREFPDVQAGFRKGRGTRDQISNICWIMEKARVFQKNIYFCFIDCAKPLTVWMTINCGKF